MSFYKNAEATIIGDSRCVHFKSEVALNYWLAYRKGSFRLKERFACRSKALDRIETLKTRVCDIEIIDVEKPGADDCERLQGFIELNAAADCFEFQRLRFDRQRRRDPR